MKDGDQRIFFTLISV